jgi:hypothetical protein
MNWQDSLRQLDTRLAKGEIGAAEYRKSRDEILAEASSGSPTLGRKAHEDLRTAAAENAAPDEHAAAETTLVVEMDPSPERRHAEPRPVEEEEVTQVLTADQIATPPPAAAAPIPPVPPPPGGPLVPPGVRPTPYRAVPIQGQEIFAEAGPKQGTSFLRLVVPLLILALVGGGVWWFALRNDGEQTPASPPPVSTSAQHVVSTDEIAGKLPELPGTPNGHNGTMSLDRAHELNLFAQPYATILADNGASEIVFRGATRPGFGYLLMASPIPPPNDADGVAVLGREDLENSGFTLAKEVSPDDPPVITRVDASFRTFLAVYSSGGVWIQLNVSAPPNGDEQELRTEFQKILAALTEQLPAD